MKERGRDVKADLAARSRPRGWSERARETWPGGQ